jgi:hypothetical protein
VPYTEAMAAEDDGLLADVTVDTMETAGTACLVSL